jgi:hypothetical protein
MTFREVRVYEIREVLRLWLLGEGFRSIERLSLVDRKTVRRYVTAAAECGLVRAGGEELSAESGGAGRQAASGRDDLAHRGRLPASALKSRDVLRRVGVVTKSDNLAIVVERPQVHLLVTVVTTTPRRKVRFQDELDGDLLAAFHHAQNL